jgi:hypothetical protein
MFLGSIKDHIRRAQQAWGGICVTWVNDSFLCLARKANNSCLQRRAWVERS